MRVGFAVILAALAVPAVAPAGTVFLLDGRGWGHGVGMSQWGAEGYARHGFGYRQILAHYYPQTTIGIAEPAAGARAPLAGTRRGPRSDRPRRSSSSTRAAASCICRRGPSSSTGSSCSGTSSCGRRCASSRARSRCRSTSRATAATSSSRRKPDGLMVVNVLPLDRYLRGVVPWEVPKGWHEADVRGAGGRRALVHARDAEAGRGLRPLLRHALADVRRRQRRAAADEPRRSARRRARCSCGDGRIDRRLLLLDLGRADVVRPRRLAEGAPGAVPRLGGGSVRLHLAASRLADHGAEREPDRRVVEGSRGARRDRRPQLVGTSAGGAAPDGARLEAGRCPARCARSSSSARPTSSYAR